MRVHCHNCEWSQDDFYDKDYNPTKSLEFWNPSLFGSEVSDIDHILLPEKDLTVREAIAQAYERRAYHIRNMKWFTLEQYHNDPNKVCPVCGSSLCED